MTPENRNLLLKQMLEAAREGKKYAAMGTVQARSFSRIIRLTKILLNAKEADVQTP